MKLNNIKYIAEITGKYNGLPFEFKMDSMQPITENDVYETIDMLGIGKDGRPYLKEKTHKPEHYIILGVKL